MFRKNKITGKQHIKKRIILMTLFLAITCWGNSIWIYAKAHLAQILIEQAWNETLSGNLTVPPWPWADTWPVAKLHINSEDKDYYVLAGSHGSSLAFGPGHLDGSAQPGTSGTIVLSGHRDTHFSFLEHQKINDQVAIQSAKGQWLHYRIKEQHIHDTKDGAWFINEDANELHLVTCYPFNSPIPGGSLRHITIAEKVDLPLNETRNITGRVASF